ncbi:MAG: PAS domain S-box protein [Spirochaetia bacterium]|jgi:PAS domain S-box-containing protein
MDVQKEHSRKVSIARSPGGPASWEPARRQFIAIALFAVLMNIVFQYLLGLLFLPLLHPLLRGLVETVAVAIFVVPPAYYFYMRPLRHSLTERQNAERVLQKSETHYRIVSELTTTFVFDLSVAEDGNVSLDFVSDDFYDFAGGNREEVRTFESLFSHIHPDDKRKLFEGLQRLIAQSQSTEIECRAYVHDPHELRWLSVCGESQWDQGAARVTAIFGAVTDITERKLAERALRESEEKYRILFDNEIYAICIFDPETQRPLDVNESFIRLSGYSREELLSDVTIPNITAEQELSEASIQLTTHEGASYVPVRYLRKKDGTIFPVELVGAPYEWKGRKLVCGIMRDISERVRMEEDRAKTQELLAISQRLAHIGSWEYELSTGKLSWSDEMYRIAGVPVKSPVTREIADSFFPPDELVRSRKAIQSALRGGPPYSRDYRVQRPDGQWKMIHNEGEVAFDEHGKAVRAFGTTQDITERTQTEEALRQNQEKLRASESKYRNLIETAPEAIYVVEDEKIIFCNNHAHEMLGYSREEMIGMPLESINHAEDWEQARERYRSRAEGNSLRKSVSRHIARDGKVIWVECVGEQIEWEGRPAVLYFSSDITDRKKAENDKMKYEQYLQQAQRLESLGVLAGGIAHDFNNILTGIFGFTDLAKNEVKDGAASEYLSQAMESMERAKALTHQLLTFAQGGAPVRKIVPIPPLIRETCQFALHGSNLRGSYDIQENLWNCDVDRNQVAQVIQNLVLNAIQAMPMGGTIEITAANRVLREKEHPTLKEGRYVAISVKDQGTGIPDEMLSRVFDPFFTTKTKGHGLGLAISHSIMSRHDGAIDVQSELGKSTTFTIYLPACGESREVNPGPASPRHVGAGRILVMDAEEPVRRLLSRMLQSFGYSVVGKESGKETTDIFIQERNNNHPFAAVILDLTIPGGPGGKEVAHEIRKHDQKVPLFVSSGYAGDPIIARPEEYGFTASISKPFKLAELAEMLEKHMAGHGPAARTTQEQEDVMSHTRRSRLP